jgi:hypothetical protein
MGYYYDWVDRQWVPKSHTQPTPRQRRARLRRRSLLQDLITEIEHGHDSVTRLYASLLTGSLLQSDEELMREFGRQVADLSHQSVKAERG